MIAGSLLADTACLGNQRRSLFLMAAQPLARTFELPNHALDYGWVARHKRFAHHQHAIGAGIARGLARNDEDGFQGFASDTPGQRRVGVEHGEVGSAA